MKKNRETMQGDIYRIMSFVCLEPNVLSSNLCLLFFFRKCTFCFVLRITTSLMADFLATFTVSLLLI